MTKNIHPIERAVRVVGGLVGWCPPYALLGISTCPKHEKAS